MKKDSEIQFRISSEHKQILKEEAEKKKISLSEFLLKPHRRLLKKAIIK